MPSVLGYNHGNLVQEKLESLQAYFGLSDAELKNVVLSHPLVLRCNHGNLVQEKLETQQVPPS